MEKKMNRKNYTEEFKNQAVELAEKIGCSQASRKLGVPLATLGKGKSKATSSRFSPDVLKLQKEVKRLKKELEEEKMITDMLKKTTAYFSKETLK